MAWRERIEPTGNLLEVGFGFGFGLGGHELDLRRWRGFLFGLFAPPSDPTQYQQAHHGSGSGLGFKFGFGSGFESGFESGFRLELGFGLRFGLAFGFRL